MRYVAAVLLPAAVPAAPVAVPPILSVPAISEVVDVKDLMPAAKEKKAKEKKKSTATPPRGGRAKWFVAAAAAAMPDGGSHS